MAVTVPSIPSMATGSPPPTSNTPDTARPASEPAETTTATADRGPSAPPSAPITSPPETTSSSQTQQRATRPSPSDFLSDKATAALIRRCLCARHTTDRGRGSPAPIDDLLPPLTSRNDVDLQLYALISIIIREFVQNWYNKITPDETFVAEIVQVIAHCTRALEQRLRTIDLESLVFDELPELLAAHIQAYRTATSPTAKPPLQTDLHLIYHSLLPLPALSPVPQAGDQASIQAQANNESAYRQLLVHGVLAVLLPTEDLENECLTSLLGQLLSELVIGNLVASKLSEPWLIWELLIMGTRLVGKRNDSIDPGSLSSNMGVQAQENKPPWSFHQAFWSMVNGIFLVVGMVRLAFSIGALSWSLPPRPNMSTIRGMPEINRGTQAKQPQSSSHEAYIGPHPQMEKTAIVNFQIWRCLGDIFEVGTRMPWLLGTLSMMQWVALNTPGRVASVNGTLDRLLSHYIHIHVLNPARLPPLLRAIRAALFPNNAPGVSSLKPPSSGEQLAALRRRCASALWGLLPKAVGELYYGTSNWAWSGVKADTTVSEKVNPRAGRLKRNSSTGILNHGSAPNGNGVDARPPHVSLDDNSSMMLNDATLSSQSKSHSHGPHEMAQTLAGHGSDNEAEILSDIETGIVDVFSDAYCNRHLVYSILELVLVRLVPELTEKGVGELWEERLH